MADYSLIALDPRTKRVIAGAITDFCSHQGEPAEGDSLEVWCPDCRRIVRAVLRAVERCSIDPAEGKDSSRG